jgi:hypothetical protein
VRGWTAKRGCGSGTETGLDRASRRGDSRRCGACAPPHISPFFTLCGTALMLWRPAMARGGQSFQSLDVPDEAEHLRHDIGFELRRSPDAAVPRGANDPPARVAAARGSHRSSIRVRRSYSASGFPNSAVSSEPLLAGLAAARSLMAAWFPTSCAGERIESQALTGTISPNGIVRLRVGVSQMTGTPGFRGWSLHFKSVA